MPDPIFDPIFLLAQSHGHGSLGKNGLDDRQWNLTLGSGVAIVPKYSGSDELKPTLFPLIEADYSLHMMTLFYSLDREGVKLFDMNDWSLSIGLSIGGNRRTDEIPYF